MKTKKIIAFVSALFAIFAILQANVFAALEDELAADKAKTNLIANGEFSDAGAMADFNGGITLKPGEGIEGSNGVEIAQNNSMYYFVQGLEAGVDYVFAVYCRILEPEGGDPPCLVIKGWGSDDIYAPSMKQDGYYRAECMFAPTDEAKSAIEVNIWNVTAGPLMIDSMYLYPYEPPAKVEAPPAAPEAEAETALDKAADSDIDTFIDTAPQDEASEGGVSTILIIVIIAAVLVVGLGVIIVAVVVGKRKDNA